jgi:hypothetical protein
MKIATIGRGNVGGGLADLWEKAGHDVHRLGSDGGDVAEAEAVLLAVPSGAIGDALERVSGLEGTTLIDATNIFEGERPGGLDSLAAYVKQTSGANVAKAFNTVFAALYDEVPARPAELPLLRRGRGQGDDGAACPRRRLRPGRRGRARERAPAGGLLRVSTAVSNAGPRPHLLPVRGARRAVDGRIGRAGTASCGRRRSDRLRPVQPPARPRRSRSSCRAGGRTLPGRPRARGRSAPRRPTGSRT